jgi:arginyl-tRNA synthetase
MHRLRSHILVLASLLMALPALANSQHKAKNACTIAINQPSDSKIDASAGSLDLGIKVPRTELRQAAVDAIAAALSSTYGITLDPSAIEAMLGTPPDFKMGQVAFPAFSFAKDLKKAPVAIAAELVTAINTNRPSILKEAVATGPYINFHFDFEAVGENVVNTIGDGKNLLERPFSRPNEKVSIEFSQPNTHKALHVGHLRNMVLGESVSRLVEFNGRPVERATYPGDLGTHIAKVIWYIRNVQGGKLPQADRADWLGQMYSDAAKYEKENEADPTIKAGISTTLRNIEEKKGDDYKLYLETREWSIDQMQDIYSWLGIKFDQWFCESSCDVPSRELVQAKLKEGLLQESDGAVGLDLKNEGLGFVMMLKSDGSGLYLTKDLELLRQKASDPTVSNFIVVVDDRQKLHFRQVFRSAELMGIPGATRAAHLAYGTVANADGSTFSSRSMNGQTLTGLRHSFEGQMAALLKARDPSLSDARIKELAQLHTTANLKFGFLKTAPANIIKFDPQEWFSFEGNTASHLIALHDTLSKQTESSISPEEEKAAYADIQTAALINHLAHFEAAVAKAGRDLDPSVVANYLAALSKQIKLVDDSHDGKKIPRLKQATAKVIQAGLKVLGIDI